MCIRDRFLLLNPSASHDTLRNHLNLAPSTTSYHIKKLTQSDIVSIQQQGKQSQYIINEPEYVINLLITFRSTFLGKAVEQFITTLVDVHPKYLRRLKDDTVDNEVDE